MNAIERELASYEGGLKKLGFHPQTIKAYSRKLRQFLEVSPHTLDANESESGAAIDEFLGGAGVGRDDFTRDASLRKWHWLRFGTLNFPHYC